MQCVGETTVSKNNNLKNICQKFPFYDFFFWPKIL